MLVTDARRRAFFRLIPGFRRALHERLLLDKTYGHNMRDKYGIFLHDKKPVGPWDAWELLFSF